MRVLNILHMGIAGAVVMVLPLQAVGAAVRPSASVPSAAATVAAQDGCERVAARSSESSNGTANGAATGLAVAECGRGGVGMGLALPAIGVIVSAVLLAILIERGTGSGRGTGFSR